MKRFIPKEKMSKKARRGVDQAKRNTWGAFSPVTRRAESGKVYNRKRARPEKDDFPDAGPFFDLIQPTLI